MIPTITVTPSIRRAYARTVSDKQIVCNEKAQVLLAYIRLIGQAMTRQQLEQTFGMPDKTMNAYLRRLMSKKLIVRSKRIKSKFYYSASESKAGFI